ncbi:hypothetical protein PENTCL1PPCAC_1792 [Pristionchus entomophagus]|uniref:Uncharacterized protein n=1 Tax=Pristionchus entomophagus TaxID=358040 RepID=A0AAV5S920_9BILA|nr:hypothetical protein PENTCL1PPCAC_1792 [Pristionchus entomophagus]
MNGPPFSRYGISPFGDAKVLHEKQSEPTPVPVPPKPQPRTTVPRTAVTVSRPVTVGALREAKEAASSPRLPITQRAKAPEVPARLKQKKKTIAFGVTTNVSQTVERERDSIPPSDPPATRPVRSQGMASLGRTGVSADRYTGTAGATGATGTTARPLTTRHTRQSPAFPLTLTPPPIGDENKNPSEVEELKETVSHLETRVVQLEKRERESREREQELQKQFERLVKHVGTLVSRVAELEGERSEEEEEVRARRRLQYSSDEEGEGRMERGRKPAKGRGDGGGGGLLNDEDTVRALERQLTLNPLLRRQLDDALEQDKYEREYGEKRTNERTRRANYTEEYDEPRAPAGRCAPSVPTHHRWKLRGDGEETGVRRERSRGPPSGGARGGGGAARKRMETTPSRRRVTERVTMERVHHFDDDSEDESGGGGMYGDDRYDSDGQPCRTQYDEEFVEDFQSIAKPDGRRGYTLPARRNQQQYGGHRAVVPVITEMSDSEEENSLDRKRRLLQERKEARERGGRNK